MQCFDLAMKIEDKEMVLIYKNNECNYSETR